jgi:diketogulonate reductase-like aldo/keto reductase
MRKIRRFILIGILVAAIIVIFTTFQVQPPSVGDYGDRIPPAYIKNPVTDRNLVLTNGVSIPRVGFGTAALGNKAGASIKAALDYGYRHIDTASDTGPWYKTERVIGNIISSGAHSRSALFITTKIHPQDHGKDHAAQAIDKSLHNLQTSYIDLMLLHYADCWGDLCTGEIATKKGVWKESWRVLEEKYNNGVLKSIGVSNFNIQQLKELWDFAKVKPHVVQNHYDPITQDREVLSFCRKNKIQFVAYSSLSKTAINHSVIQDLAQKYHRTPAQIILKWLMQQDIVVLPRSTNLNHIRDNINIFGFRIEEDDLNSIQQLRV